MFESMHHFINYKTHFLMISYDKIMYTIFEMKPSLNRFFKFYPPIYRFHDNNENYLYCRGILKFLSCYL